MKMTYRFSVDRFPGSDKWIAQASKARKVDGMPFGIYGVEATTLGVFKTRDAALAAVEAKKVALRSAAAA